MSSIVVSLRALVMLACLLAVPVLAFTQPDVLARARQAGTRLLDRLGAKSEPASTTPAVARRPLPQSDLAPPSRDAYEQRTHVGRSMPLLPEPVADELPAPQVTRFASVSVPAMAERFEPLDEVSQVSASVPSASHSVEQWQQRASALQELGAVEYALEKWGSSGKLYRFRCLVAVEGARSYQRHFEAIHDDGGRAVEQVLQQVRSWRKAETSVD